MDDPIVFLLAGRFKDSNRDSKHGIFLKTLVCERWDSCLCSFINQDPTSIGEGAASPTLPVSHLTPSIWFCFSPSLYFLPHSQRDVNYYIHFQARLFGGPKTQIDATRDPKKRSDVTVHRIIEKQYHQYWYQAVKPNVEEGRQDDDASPFSESNFRRRQDTGSTGENKTNG